MNKLLTTITLLLTMSWAAQAQTTYPGAVWWVDDSTCALVLDDNYSAQAPFVLQNLLNRPVTSNCVNQRLITGTDIGAGYDALKMVSQVPPNDLTYTDAVLGLGTNDRIWGIKASTFRAAYRQAIDDLIDRDMNVYCLLKPGKKQLPGEPLDSSPAGTMYWYNSIIWQECQASGKGTVIDLVAAGVEANGPPGDNYHFMSDMSTLMGNTVFSHM